MSREIVFMYSGQGSQYYGMGADLFGHEPVFRAAIEECDRALRGRLARSIASAICEPARREVPFDDLVESHVALFAVQYALTRVVMTWGTAPSCSIGYSIGELIAFTAAGGISLTRGLELARDQAQLVLNESPEAGMLAVLASPQLLPELQGWYSDVWLGADNLERHFVIVAERPTLLAIRARLWDADISSQFLPVHRGFHSGLIQPLEAAFRELAAPVDWGTTAWPILSSTTAKQLVPSGDHWWRVAREPVRFRETFDAASRSSAARLYLDLGPSGTLAGFARHSLGHKSSSRALPLLARSGRDLDRLKEARAALERWMLE